MSVFLLHVCVLSLQLFYLLSACLHMYACLSLYLRPFVSLSAHLSSSPSVCLFACLPLYISLSNCPPVQLLHQCVLQPSQTTNLLLTLGWSTVQVLLWLQYCKLIPSIVTALKNRPVLNQVIPSLKGTCDKLTKHPRESESMHRFTVLTPEERLRKHFSVDKMSKQMKALLLFGAATLAAADNLQGAPLFLANVLLTTPNKVCIKKEREREKCLQTLWTAT